MQVLVVLLVGEGGKGAGDMATYFAAHWVEEEVEVEVGQGTRRRSRYCRAEESFKFNKFKLRILQGANFKTFLATAPETKRPKKAKANSGAL